MANRLIQWSLENRPLVLGLTAAFLAWGGFAINRLPVDVLPDLSAPTVLVMAEQVGMSPVEMERLITLPIESAANGVSGVRRVRSATAVGASLIWIEFDWGMDVYRARQLVRERLEGVGVSLPQGTVGPTIGPVTSYLGEIVFIALTSDELPPVQVRTVADRQVRRRLVAVPGVAQVSVIGGGQKQYEVLVSPNRLSIHRISVGEVADALSAASANSSAGFLVQAGQEYLLQGVGIFNDIDDIRNTVVRSTDSIPVRIADLARVRAGQRLRRGDASLNGTPAVIIGVRKQPGVNTLEVTASIDRALDELGPSLPADVDIHRHVFRQSEFIEAAISNLEEAASYGALLVVVAVLIFLANARASVVTLLAIPFSLAGAVLGMSMVGLTINGMTIGGLAIALGQLVDDAVIDVENILRRMRQNTRLPRNERLTTLAVVYQASSEVRKPIVFATFIVVLVFAPVFFLGGIEGRLLRPLGFAYAVALISSLLVALSVTPVLCSYLLARRSRRRSGREPVTARLLKRAYRPVLEWGLDNGKTVLAASGIVIVAAALGLGSVGRSFLPAFQEGTLTISAVTVPGTSLEAANRLGTALERALLAVPEVVLTGRRTGRDELDDHLQGVESAEIDVRLQLGERPREDVLDEIRARASLVPGMRVNIGQPISHRIDHMLSGSRSNVAVKVFGEDFNVLRSLASQVERVMREVPGVVDLVSDQQADVPTVSVEFRRDDLARYALPAGDAAHALKTVFLGKQVGSVREGLVAYPLVLRYEGGAPDGIDDIGGTRIDTPSGAWVPLSALADIREDRSPNVVARENIERRITVSCNVAGRDLRGVVSDVQQRVATTVNMPRGYRIEYGGQHESEERATGTIVAVGALVLVGIGVLLVTAFRSTRDAFIVLANLPFALAGGVVGVYLSGSVLSVASLIGFIALFGVATRNGILLVSHIRHLYARNPLEGLRSAIVRGSSERLLPVLMTATSTGLALVPIAMGTGRTGSELHAPLALVILCGLATATILNMIVVPAVYLRFGRQPDEVESVSR